MTNRSAYAAAGVDVEAGDRAVGLLRARIGRPDGDLLGLGAFGAALEIPPGYRRPVLVTATDGVGTKTEIARRLGRLDTIGHDLVAMCADDVVCHGARPTYFLDYLAVGRIDPDRVAELVGGIASACEAIGCALVGGETAEHPGLMADEAFDLAGFCIGFVERDEVLDGPAARAGDIVIGLASSGLHANGFSLVRRLLDAGTLPLTEDLLTPTRLYAPAVLGLVARLRDADLRIGGLAHVTGGGLPGNLPRAVSSRLGITVRVDSWPEPPVFESVARGARMGGPEMRATFNCGIGMAVVVEPAAIEVSVATLEHQGIPAWPIGEVHAVDEGSPRYVEVG